MAELETCKFADIKEEDDINIYTSPRNGIENSAYTIGKANSLPPNTSIKCWDDVICSALRVSPEDLASQLTLLDLPTFTAIHRDELTSCSWNKKNKLTTAPNVVAFTRRFNQVSFWTVQEVLNGSSPKHRAETIAHFIKVAKKLYELNNLHSLFAVISALQSVSIFRLTKTWACLSKKDKSLFERLAAIFTENNNWALLREYLQSLKLPCIPYLGIFLTDLVYIDMAHPVGALHRSNKMNAILVDLTLYQTSNYNLLKPLHSVQDYLTSVRYIEELQKFLEDDQYKLSLKLEPPSPTASAYGSKESVKVREAPSTSANLSPSNRNGTGSLRLPSTTIPSKFLPGHRKCRSLTKFRSTSLPRNFHKMSGNAGIINKNYTMPDAAVDNNSSVVSGVNLLDDTLLESPASTPQSILSSGSLNSHGELPGEMPLDFSGGFQGSVRRKTILKDGRKPSVSSWQRYWLQIWANSLVYFSPKSFKASSRADFKRQPCKMMTLDGWTTKWPEAENSDSFHLVNHTTSCIYKFRTGSQETTQQWAAQLQTVTFKPEKPLPANLMSFE